MKTWKFLLILLLSLVIIKTLLASLVLAPSMFSDEYEYAKMARAIWETGIPAVHGDTHIEFPPLYPTLLAPAYALKDMRVAYFIMKLINALLSTLIIIPAYLLGKEIMNEKKARIATVLVGIMPATVSYTGYIMSENLFIPLTLLFAYFMYKQLTTDSWTLKLTFSAILGILMFIIHMTRTLSVAIFGAVCLLLFFSFLTLLFEKKSKNFIPSSLMFVSVTLAAIFIFKKIENPLFQYGGQILPQATHTFTQVLATFLIWFLIYTGYIILSSGFILPLAIFSRKKFTENQKAFFLVTAVMALSGIIIAARQDINPSFLNSTIFSSISGRSIGRYLDFCLPLLVIGGVASLNEKISKPFGKIIITIAITSIMLVSASGLFPINHLSLSLAGLLKYLYEIIAPISMLSPHYFIFAIIIGTLTISIISLLMHNYKNKRFLITLIFIFFLTTSLFNFAFAAYNAKTGWYDQEQMQLGLWINDQQLEGTFLIDEKAEGKVQKNNKNPLYEKDASTIIGFWLNNEIRIGSTDNLKSIDYVLSKELLDLPLIKQTSGEIYLYQVPKKDKE